MTTVQSFIRRKTILTLTTCATLGLATPYAFAGFEWVPPTQKKMIEAPAVPTAPVPSAAKVVDDGLFLPLPSDVELMEPEPVTIVEETPAAQTAVPTRITVMPKEEPNSGAIVNHAPEPIEEPMLPPLEITMKEMPAPIIESNDPEMLKKPPFEMTKTRIILSDDAPLSAIEQTQKNDTAITAFPSKKSLQDTAEPNVVFENNDQSLGAFSNESSYEDAVGFATDVPLAIALQQIVPAGYAYSFGTIVNPGVRISWNGGKAWNEVIADVVVPLGYSVAVKGKVVHIGQPSANEALAPITPTPHALEPAAGAEEAIDIVEASVERERNIKRINIMDPGT